MTQHTFKKKNYVFRILLNYEGIWHCQNPFITIKIYMHALYNGTFAYIYHVKTTFQTMLKILDCER